MTRFLFVAVAVLAFVAMPAQAAKRMTEKDKCLQSVADVVEMAQSEETPGIGKKAQAQVDELLEIATHLCDQGNFKYAESLVSLARGMLASE